MKALAAALLGALFALSFGLSSRAASAASLVEWDAPEACPGALEVHTRLSAVLGYEPEKLGKLSRVRGSVMRTPRGFRLVLEAFEQGRRSSRLFEAASCDDLVDAAALAIALALAPDRSSASLRPATTAGSEPNGVTPARSEAGTRDVLPRIPSARSEAPHLRPFAAADAVLEYGALPQLATGLAIAGGVHLGVVSLGGYGVLLGAQRLRVAPAQNVEFELLFGGVRACSVLLDRALRLEGCAHLELGRFSALGLALSPSREARDLWLAAGGSLQALWPLNGALAVELRAEPMLPFGRKQYTVNGSEAVHAPAVLSSRLYLGMKLLSD